MRVRPITLDDAATIAAILAAVAEERIWIGTEPPVDVTARTARIREQHASGLAVGWLLVDDAPAPAGADDVAGEAVGCLSLVSRERDPAVATLGMAILAEARGRGGGRLLMEAAVGYATEARMHKIDLEVWPENARAISLYAAFGFQVEGLRRDHYLRIDGSRRSSLLMARFIDGAAHAGADGGCGRGSTAAPPVL